MVTAGVLLLAAGLRADSNQAPVTQPSTQKSVTTQPASEAQAIAEEKERLIRKFAPGSGETKGSDSKDDKPKPRDTGPGSIWYAFASAFVVLVLGGLAMIVVRKVLPKLRIKQGRRIRVIETAYLSARKSVHLIQVGSQTFLLAGGKDSITAISEVKGVDADLEIDSEADKA